MGNAAGRMLRPLILYKGKIHIESHFRDTHDTCYIGTNSSGVMDTEVLTDFLGNEFLSSSTCPKNVLFCDEHSSHLSCIPFLVACVEHDKKSGWSFLHLARQLSDSRWIRRCSVSRHDVPAHIVKL
ncbi:hypothetical protein RvY_03942 [Ramazzottius varieornatus]|uniref:DDE-1 domain-containing protein n=1 Tax=Ramazzottius varieornatus TaxID=947166 RepID=A0A1D1UZ50_RAMVA|nr:hypothetical protein RvY_03942 [Ramazzottius varieornatus]